MTGSVAIVGARSNPGKIISDAINGRDPFLQQAMAQGEKPAKAPLTRKEAELVTKEWYQQYRGASGIDVADPRHLQAELEKALGLAAQDGLIRRAAFDDDSGISACGRQTPSPTPSECARSCAMKCWPTMALANVLGDGEYTPADEAASSSPRSDPSMKPVGLGKHPLRRRGHRHQSRGSWWLIWRNWSSRACSAVAGIGSWPGSPGRCVRSALYPMALPPRRRVPLIEGLGQEVCSVAAQTTAAGCGGQKFSQEAERPTQKGGIKMSQASTTAMRPWRSSTWAPKPDIIDKDQNQPEQAPSS